MSLFFGFELVFMPHRSAIRLLRPFHYVGHAVKTLQMLRKIRPNIVWVQLPPTPLLTAVLLYRRLYDRTVRIVADCHNSIFGLPWCKWPGIIGQLNSLDVVMIHSHRLVNKAVELGICKDSICVLEDPPALIEGIDSTAVSYPRPWVLFLTSFAPDEPITELFSAAALAPDLHFVIAGDLRRASGRHRMNPHPPNVFLPGYLSGAHLDATIMEADAILALTRHDDQQLSTAAEAVGAGKAMILADTPLLREMYDCGAVYVKVNEPSSIALGCQYAVTQRLFLEEGSVKLRTKRWIHWRRGAAALANLLAIPDEA